MSRAGLALYIGRRVLAMVALIFMISFVVFSLLYLAPGSPEKAMLGARPSTPETIEAIREEYHLNDPFLVQYGESTRDALRFDFGRSIRTNEAVLDGISDRVKLTFKLGGSRS